jgi:rod shape-determining protein MreD
MSTVFPNINIADTAPDLIVCTMAAIVIIENSMTGAYIGLACGLFLDLFTGIIGYHALPYFLTGAIIFFIRKNIYYVDKIVLPFFLAIGAYFLREGLAAILAYTLDKQFSLSDMFLRYMLPEAAMTGVFMFIVHIAMRKLFSIKGIKKRSPEDFRRLS